MCRLSENRRKRLQELESQLNDAKRQLREKEKLKKELEQHKKEANKLQEDMTVYILQHLDKIPL